MESHRFKKTIFILLLGISSCSFPEKNHIRRVEYGDSEILYKLDTIVEVDGKKGLIGVGLIGLSDGEKHGMWSYYSKGKLIRIESFKNDIKDGPYIVFTENNFGDSEVQAMAYKSNGVFNGPALYLKSNGIINFYDYYRGNKSISSITIDSSGTPRVKIRDSLITFKRVIK